MRSLEDDEFASRYLVVVKFEAQEDPLPVRASRDVPIIHKTLQGLAQKNTAPSLAFSSKDGSVLGILLRTSKEAAQIRSAIQLGTTASPTRLRDQIFVIDVGGDNAVHNNDRVLDWLSR